MHQQPWVSNKILAKAKVLVTGGAGFIGSHIAQYLLNHGAAMVRVLDNMSNGRLENIAILKQYPNFEFIEGDVRNMETCQLVASGITHITHQAALGSVPRSIANPTDSVSTNVTGTVNILQAAVLFCKKVWRFRTRLFSINLRRTAKPFNSTPKKMSSPPGFLFITTWD